jgi:hypothetical protein
MGDCADRFCMPESRNESAIDDREDRALAFTAALAAWFSTRRI